MLQPLSQCFTDNTECLYNTGTLYVQFCWWLQQGFLLYGFSIFGLMFWYYRWCCTLLGSITLAVRSWPRCWRRSCRWCWRGSCRECCRRRSCPRRWRRRSCPRCWRRRRNWAIDRRYCYLTLLLLLRSRCRDNFWWTCCCSWCTYRRRSSWWEGAYLRPGF